MKEIPIISVGVSDIRSAMGIGKLKITKMQLKEIASITQSDLLRTNKYFWSAYDESIRTACKEVLGLDPE